MTLGAYTRTQILVAVVDAVGIGIGAAFLQLPLRAAARRSSCSSARSSRSSAPSSPASIAVLVALVTQGWGSALDHARPSCCSCSSSRATSCSRSSWGTPCRCTPWPCCWSVDDRLARRRHRRRAVRGADRGRAQHRRAVPARARQVPPAGHRRPRAHPRQGAPRRSTAPSRPRAEAESEARRHAPGARRDAPDATPGRLARDAVIGPAGRPRRGGAARRRRRAHPGAAQPRAVASSSARTCWLKCENLQRAGSFKIRGAYTRMARLTPEEKARGVVAASAGNHAQGVALAAGPARRSTPSIFMPVDAALPKIAATRGLRRARSSCVGHVGRRGARGGARRTPTAPGAVLIHPFDHPDVDRRARARSRSRCSSRCPTWARSSCRVGGGGLAAGIAAALADRPDVPVVGVQAARAAAYPASLAAGRPVPRRSCATMADGIAVGHPRRGRRSSCCAATASPVRTVSEEDLSRALLLVAERAKLVVEPSGAAAVAALMADPRGFTDDGRPVVCVLSGGNIDPLVLLRVVRHGLASAGRYLQLHVVVEDTPGRARGPAARRRRRWAATSCTSATCARAATSGSARSRSTCRSRRRAPSTAPRCWPVCAGRLPPAAPLERTDRPRGRPHRSQDDRAGTTGHRAGAPCSGEQCSRPSVGRVVRVRVSPGRGWRC